MPRCRTGARVPAGSYTIVQREPFRLVEREPFRLVEREPFRRASVARLKASRYNVADARCFRRVREM